MKRARLKSRSGCQKCKDRRRKCDEIKPVCGDCARLQFVCSWAAPDQPPLRAIDRARRSVVFTLRERDSGTASSSWELLNTTQNAARLGDRHGRVFDSPSILRTHAVPDDGTAECKHILQYLNEKGTVMLKLPAERLPPDHDHNLFRAAFGLASREPVLLQSHLCLSAGHLCRIHPSYERIALKYYNIVLSKLRGELAVCVARPPAEWACGVAAVLSFYELLVFRSPQSRLAHLVGYHRLVEARMYHQVSWGPFRILLEQYIHSLTIGSLFHHKLLVSQRPITYVEGLIDILNEGPRPLGREIAGVPEELTVVVYRLTFLNFHDIEQSPWDAELVATATKLANWMPAPHAFLPSGAGLLLVAQLYHLACTCLLQNIMDRTADATNDVIGASLEEAAALLEITRTQSWLFNSMVWPLAILSVFAVDPEQRSAFERPISILIGRARVEGYQSILSFLALIEAKAIGPRVLLRPDFLSMVHM